MPALHFEYVQHHPMIFLQISLLHRLYFYKKYWKSCIAILFLNWMGKIQLFQTSQYLIFHGWKELLLLFFSHPPLQLLCCWPFETMQHWLKSSHLHSHCDCYLYTSIGGNNNGRNFTENILYKSLKIMKCLF